MTDDESGVESLKEKITREKEEDEAKKKIEPLISDPKEAIDEPQPTTTAESIKNPENVLKEQAEQRKADKEYEEKIWAGEPVTNEDEIVVKPTLDVSKNKEKYLKPFKDPGLMLNIKDELSKGHLENDKEKLLTFVIAITNRLPPEDRVSEKLRGGTSVGKTNLVNTCVKHLPRKWYIYTTRITRASLEDDIKDINLIIMLEKSRDKDIAEAIKQVSEDGIEIWKKDPKTNKQTHEGYIPRKSVIDTSTSEESDEEVANRALIAHIKEDIKRFQKVVNEVKIDVSRLDKILDKKNENKDSWIKLGLRQLEDFDDILIPGAEAIPIEVKNASEGRIQRDTKRFFGLVKAIAWLNQKNRKQIIGKDIKILVAQVEDICWAQYLSDEAFRYSISGASPRIEDMLKTIDKLVTDGEVEEKNGKMYVPRQKVQEKLEIKAEKTIRERAKEAESLGMVEIYRYGQYAPAYIRRTGSLKVRPLIRYKWDIIYKILKPLQKKLFYSQFIANLYPNYSENYSSINTCLPDNNMNINNIAINNLKYMPDKIENYTYEQLIDYIYRKFIAEIYSDKEPNIGAPVRRVQPIPVGEHEAKKKEQQGLGDGSYTEEEGTD